MSVEKLRTVCTVNCQKLTWLIVSGPYRARAGEEGVAALESGGALVPAAEVIAPTVPDVGPLHEPHGAAVGR